MARNFRKKIRPSDDQPWLFGRRKTGNAFIGFNSNRRCDIVCAALFANMVSGIFTPGEIKKRLYYAFCFRMKVMLIMSNNRKK